MVFNSQADIKHIWYSATYTLIDRSQSSFDFWNVEMSTVYTVYLEIFVPAYLWFSGISTTLSNIHTGFVSLHKDIWLKS